MTQKLDDYWLALRLEQLQIPTKALIKRDKVVDDASGITFTDALALYLRLKGAGKSKVFTRAAERNTEYLVECVGDKPIPDYSSIDAGKFRDWLIERNMTIVTVKRVFATIRAIVNLAISETGLNCKNPFSGIYMPEDNEPKKRKPIPLTDIRRIQSVCRKTDDELRWLVALISDSGMRLAEAAGLTIDDIKLDDPIPHIDLTPHPWRSLKTKSSSRKIPLVGASLWAAERVVSNANSPYAFPRYTDGTETNANSASAALNKWLKNYVPDGCVVHSFRHSMRDRLRAVECPSDITDQIGGWAKTGIGAGYGDGYSLDVLAKWVSKISGVSSISPTSS